MAEPTLPDTLSTDPDELFKLRSGLTRDLLDLRARADDVQDRIALAQYRDPSQLGADRARISLAGRMLNEVSANITDLAFASDKERAE